MSVCLHFCNTGPNMLRLPWSHNTLCGHMVFLASIFQNSLRSNGILTIHTRPYHVRIMSNSLISVGLNFGQDPS